MELREVARLITNVTLTNADFQQKLVGSIQLLVNDVADADEPYSSTDQIEERGENGKEAGRVVSEGDQSGGEESVGKQMKGGDENLTESLLAEGPSLGLDDTCSSEHHNYY